jgi:hypothetical protein
MIDLTKTVWILAMPQGERLAVLGGSNDEQEARKGAQLIHDCVLLRAEPAPVDEAKEG